MSSFELRARASQGQPFASWSHVLGPVQAHGLYGTFVQIRGRHFSSLPPLQVPELKWCVLQGDELEKGSPFSSTRGVHSLASE